jgi:hypothetical protein
MSDMIKMVVEVWKRPDMTDAQFRERWLGAHGALVREHGPAMGFVRYIQSHKIPAPAIESFASERGWKPAPDGITEVWWDSEDAMNAAMGSPAGVAASAILEADEKHFCDTRKLSAFLAAEEVIFDFTTAHNG